MMNEELLTRKQQISESKILVSTIEEFFGEILSKLRDQNISE